MAMFDERDKDHDGLLSFEEFSGQETKMERAFKSMDKDGDGFITKSEFKLVCKNLTKGISLFHHFNFLSHLTVIRFNLDRILKLKIYIQFALFHGKSILLQNMKCITNTFYSRFKHESFC